MIDPEGVVMECPSCANSARMIGKSVKPYCTVFWIPLFPEGGGQEFIECSSCGAKFHGSVDRIRGKISKARARLDEELDEAEARWRDAPTDLEAAADLLERYMGADRKDEAVRLATRLAAEHPADANLQVMVGRVFLAVEQNSDALGAFDRAVAANDQHAGAHFFRAIALLQLFPGETSGALAEARTANDLGYPAARDLVRSIEQRSR